MKKEKPFDITNATYIPNQLIDKKYKFLSNQQKVFMIYLWRRLYGLGETEIKLSYSVVFEDFPCIIKNKQKFSDMIKDLEIKGLIKIERGHKKCHTYIIEEEHYNKLVYWGVNYKGGNNADNKSIIEFDTSNIDLTEFDINENSVETLQKVYQYEYKKLYPKRKKDFTKYEFREKFCILKYQLDEISNIHYATFIRCYFINYFNNDYLPNIDKIYENGIDNYKKYKDIVIQTPLEDDTMARLFRYVYDGYLSLNNKSIKEYIEKNKLYCITDRNTYPHIFYCSKTYIDYCKSIKPERRNEIIERIKRYPVIMDYIKNILKDDFTLEEIENKTPPKIIIDNEKKKKEDEELKRKEQEQADEDLKNSLKAILDLKETIDIEEI